MQSVMDARAFLQRMFEMTEWAAQQDLMVSEFRADWASFGSWAIKVEKGHRALRAVWDGKEQLLTVDTAPAANAETHSGMEGAGFVLTRSAECSEYPRCSGQDTCDG
jgi:hypothetical protein